MKTLQFDTIFRSDIAEAVLIRSGSAPSSIQKTGSVPFNTGKRI